MLRAQFIRGFPPAPDMTPLAIQHKPQTLKQAKKAYKQAGATPRFSKLELRRLDRCGELLERADRLKAKGRQKKANKKKRDEKLGKEKEARRKAGLPEVREAYVGASQLKLDFVGAATRLKENEQTENQCPHNFMKQPSQLPTRGPLQPRSSNIISIPKSQETSPNKCHNTATADSIDLVACTTRIEQELSSPNTLYLAGSTPCSLPRAAYDETSELLAMVSTQDLSDPEELGSIGTHLEAETKLISKPGMEGLEKDRFCISLEELEDCGIENEPSEELELNSTQDLGGFKDHVPVLPEPATDNLPPSSAIKSENFGSDGVYTDENFQNLAQVIELNSAEKETPVVIDTVAEISDSAKHKRQKESDSFYDENAPSSQELLEMAHDIDFCEFDISTQDLQDLYP